MLLYFKSALTYQNITVSTGLTKESEVAETIITLTGFIYTRSFADPPLVLFLSPTPSLTRHVKPRNENLLILYHFLSFKTFGNYLLFRLPIVAPFLSSLLRQSFLYFSLLYLNTPAITLATTRLSMLVLNLSLILISSTSFEVIGVA